MFLISLSLIGIATGQDYKYRAPNGAFVFGTKPSLISITRIPCQRILKLLAAQS